MNVNDPQPKPAVNDNPFVWDLVIADLEKRHYIKSEIELVKEQMLKRDEYGVNKYGTRLQAGNTRNPLFDAVQEFLDALVYLKQANLETNNAEVDYYLEYQYWETMDAVINLIMLIDRIKNDKDIRRI